MIFKLNGAELYETKADFTFNELQFEKLIVQQNQIHEMNFHIFNEAFLYLGRQVNQTNGKTIFYALDTRGAGVMLELNQQEGMSSLDTSSMHTLQLMTAKKADDFVNYCLGRNATEEEMFQVKQFIQCDYTQVNGRTRLVVLARNFDPAVFTFGSWLSDANFGFKAIRYYSTKINQEHLVEFSLGYNSENIQVNTNYKLPLNSLRKPGVFFHDIGHAEEKWWNFLQKAQVITSSYDNVESPVCRGYTILNQYVPGDVVIAYSKTHGVVGFGTVTSKGYAYKNHDMRDFSGTHYHTRTVQWEAVLPLVAAVPMTKIQSMGLICPTQTKQEIRYNRGTIDALLNEIKTASHKKKAA